MGCFGYTNKSGEGLHGSENERVLAKALRLAQSCLFFKRATQLMNIRCISAISAAIFLAAGLPSVADAAFYDGTEPVDSGRAFFPSSSSQLYGYVDYAVYSPGYFAGSDSFPDKFFYCYQIFNSSGSSSIGRFTVTLDTGETAYSPDYFVFSEGDISPLTVFSSPTTVAYLFSSTCRIPANHNSSVLFFAADSGSIAPSVIIAGTMTGSVSFQIPSPVPEPASVLFLSLAAPFLFKYRRRKS
jgi:hypothetical protein